MAPAMRSLSTLRREYEARRRRQAAAPTAAPPCREKEVEEEARLREAAARAVAVAATLGPPRLRPLEELTYEFNLRRLGAQAAAAPARAPAKAAAGASKKEVAQKLASHSYSREELLAAQAVLKAAGRLQAPRGFALRTVPTPAPATSVAAQAHAPRPPKGVAWVADVEEDQRLNDERIVAQLEAALSRESGFDEKNFETFGALAAAGGWSFEAAVEANARIWAWGGNACTNPEAARCVMREVYTAASKTTEGDECAGAPQPRLDLEQRCAAALPGKRGAPQGEDGAASTAAPSGAATPAGSAASGRAMSPASGAGSERDQSTRACRWSLRGAGGVCFQ